MPTDHEPDHLGPAKELLFTALALGKKALASGDAEGCYELCACAGRLARKLKGVSEIADFRLEQCLDHAGAETEPMTQANVMISAFGDLTDGEESAGPAVPEDPLLAMKTYIEMAISIGAPAYNTGDHQGCFEVYACTARMLVSEVKGADAATAKLREALNACEESDEANERAWTMRHAFDAIGEMGNAPNLTPQEVQLYLSLAIRIGAPAYNVGDHRGCYEVYACAARFLVNAASIPEDVKSTLRSALERASTVQNVGRQAWLLRIAFDSLLPSSSGSDSADPPPDSPEE
jgi:hypothetical protein